VKRFTYLALVATLLLPAWCSAGISVTDFRGEKLELDKPVTRIVCLIESALTGLYMLGAQDRVVGVPTNIYTGTLYDTYSAMDQRIKEKRIPSPGNWDFVNIESIVALSPDLVIIWAHQEESIRSLEEKGIPVFGVSIRKIEDVYHEMMALGELTETLERGKSLVEYSKNQIASFTKEVDTIEDYKKPGVYFMWAQGELESAGRPSAAHELIGLSGGKNICGNINQVHCRVSREKILTDNPNVIVMWYNQATNPAQIASNSLWQRVSAVRDRRVHEFPSPFFCDFWTLKYQHAVKMVAKWCHPERFKTIDLEQEQDLMMENLYPKSKKQ